ncbi:MAG TPA: Uma2 family endonuclease, partial [Saprospiraceae bacterium]|nr:Uma2 family endonuclease [Saprospiraceae bacterium]
PSKYSEKYKKRATQKSYALDVYFQREDRSKNKNEFYDGKIVKMAGATANHNQIAAQITSAFIVGIKNDKKTFKVYNSDQKIWIPQTKSVLYPDALVISGQPEFYKNRKDTITNPLVIVEVLSPRTMATDLFEKFGLYQNIPSFMEYIIISQSNVGVEKWVKIAENTWQKKEYKDIADVLQIASVGIDIPLYDVYYDIQFE